jgi:hypothetical protein
LVDNQRIVQSTRHDILAAKKHLLQELAVHSHGLIARRRVDSSAGFRASGAGILNLSLPRLVGGLERLARALGRDAFRPNRAVGPDSPDPSLKPFREG